MKRQSESGDSPRPKHLLEESDASSYEIPFSFLQRNSSITPEKFPDFLLRMSQESTDSYSSFPKVFNTNPPSDNSGSLLELIQLPSLFVCLLMWWAGNCSITESLPELIQQVRQDLAGAAGGQP